jgi:hypothetical protein
MFIFYYGLEFEKDVAGYDDVGGGDNCDSNEDDKEGDVQVDDVEDDDEEDPGIEAEPTGGEVCIPVSTNPEQLQTQTTE